MHPPDLCDIDKIILDGSDDDVTIEWSEANADGSVSVKTLTVDLDAASPDYLQASARKFAAAVVRAVGEDVHKPDENPCNTCIGACCAISYETVHVFQEDIDRMRERLRGDGVSAARDIHREVEKMVEFYPHTLWTGALGELIRVDYKDGERLCCVNLRDDGCAIYEHRPRICREYTSWDCEIHEEDPEKVDGKVRLRVVSS